MAQPLHELLARRTLLLAPGAYDAFSARLVEAAGFACVFMSGAGVSYTRLAQPDLGLVTQSEMTSAVRCLRAGTGLPLLCDADDGYGNAMNVRRTVQDFEAAGASGIQLEDQAFPKRCGHLAGKTLVSTADMVQKVRAAVSARRSRHTLIVARTDARSVEGLDAAIARARAYREAGADLLFVEAPESELELREVTRALPGVPHVVNMVEGGRTPPFPAAELEAMGFALALYPNTLLRVLAKQAAEVLAELAARGGTMHLGERMLSFDALNELLGLAEFGRLAREFGT